MSNLCAVSVLGAVRLSPLDRVVMYHPQGFETGSPCSFSQDSMEVGLLVHNYVALESPEESQETMQIKIWALHDELFQKAAMAAGLNKQPMEFFYVSGAELKELADDKQRLRRLTMKLRAVEGFLAAWKGSAAASVPSGPSEMGQMAARTTTTVAPILSCPKPVNPPVLPLHSSNESSSTPSSNTEPRNKRKFCNLGYYMETYSNWKPTALI